MVAFISILSFATLDIIIIQPLYQNVNTFDTEKIKETFDTAILLSCGRGP